MIKVLKSGFYDTIQDLGRLDFQEFGVPISGAMDHYSAKIANALVGNTSSEAVLEMTLLGPKLEFQHDNLISITGADLSPSINGIAINRNKAIFVKLGDILCFGKPKLGTRGYLAVSGGFKTELSMNSRSMCKNITNAFKIKTNAILPTLPFRIKNTPNPKASLKTHPKHFSNSTLKVFKGPEFELLSPKQQDSLLHYNFCISQKNSRMAYQLVETLENQLKPIITSLVLPGTVQLTPSGKLIILMRDCQTTGGYPRVLQLSETAINMLSQKFTNDYIHFKITN
ncbi:MAG: biotin-dependent carboxyltransferase family protein [Flavobacteriaceae bacterium]|nr:biotin-dependent carboxyltransferase family protein [Flavobacteriaceae bacterium]